MDHNLEVVLSPKIPGVILEHMAAIVTPFVEQYLGPVEGLEGKERWARPDVKVDMPGRASSKAVQPG